MSIYPNKLTHVQVIINYSGDLNNEHLNSKLSLVLYSDVRYSDVWYSNGGLNTGHNLVRYSNGIRITDHLVIRHL